MVSHQPGLLSARSLSAGLSLVELLVATLVTLIGLLVITQVFAVYEGWKRTTTGVAQTQESGLLGAFAIEQDLRNAGFGIVGTGCSEIIAYNRAATPSKFTLSRSGAGVSITPFGDDNNVRIDVVYSSSPYANVAVRMQKAMLSDTDLLYVDNAIGIEDGNLILISDGKSCSVRQVSGKSTGGKPNVTSAGDATVLELGASQPWNPPTGDESFSGYTLGSRVLNLGKVIRHSYYLQGQTLRMDDYDKPENGSLTSYDLVSGVVGLRAVCLPDAKCGSQTTAVRFSLAVQSAVREKIDKDDPSKSEITREIVYWPGESQELEGEQRYYRYRVFTTIVPFKNVIWNPK